MALLQDHLLALIVVLPLAGAVLALCFPAEQHAGLRGLALGVGCLELVLVGLCWHLFDPATPGLQLRQDAVWSPSLGLHWALGVDGVGLLLMGLTALLAPLLVLDSRGSVGTRLRAYITCLLLLQGALYGAFAAADMLLFYVFYELMLVPAFFIVGIWGGAASGRAASRFFVYTMAGSLLMLAAIVYTAVATAGDGPLSFDWATTAARLAAQPLGAAEPWLFAAFALAFAIKTPLLPLHAWLSAYVEAPAGGAVLLSGILSKVGAFGLLRYAMTLFPATAAQWAPTLAALAAAGILYGALLALVQQDLKRLLAYASLSHLGFVVLGIAGMTPVGLAGSMVQMVNHGISMGGLFLLVGMLEGRRGSSALAALGGLAAPMPRAAVAFVVLALAALGLPGLGNFVGEFLVLIGSFAKHSPPLALSTAQVATFGLAVAQLSLLAGTGLLTARLWRPAALGAPPVGPASRAAAVGGFAAFALLLAAPRPLLGGGLLARALGPSLDDGAHFTECFALLAVLASVGTLLAAAYMLRGVQATFFGPQAAGQAPPPDLSGREQLVLLPLLVTTVLFGVYPQPLMRLALPAASAYAARYAEHAGEAGLARARLPRRPPAAAAAARR